MKRDVWVVADSIVSPLGTNTSQNYSHVQQGKSGVKQWYLPQLSKEPVYVSYMDSNVSVEKGLSRLETISLMSLTNALQNLKLLQSKTVFIFSTTKGNVDLLQNNKNSAGRLGLYDTADFLNTSVGLTNQPLVVSNACTSGLAAILLAHELLEDGTYDHAVVLGVDVLSYFITSGFQSLQAISPEPCKPFDENRKGINLGEAAATIVLSSNTDDIGAGKKIKISGGGLSNDANHISGPSRTGVELGYAIEKAMEAAHAGKDQLDFISAHGTATRYNDEMEAKAFHHQGLQDIPVHSLKGYFGHTLGAAGILETILCVQSLLHNELIPSHGFEKQGTSQPLQVITKKMTHPLTTCLKTASGFGGCNAALVLEKTI